MKSENAFMSPSGALVCLWNERKQKFVNLTTILSSLNSSKRYISMCPTIILMRKECIRKREHTTSLQVGSSKKHSDFPKPVGNEANTWRPCKTAFVTCICSFFSSNLEHVWRMSPKCIVIAICSVPILFIMPAKFISRKLWLTWKW